MDKVDKMVSELMLTYPVLYPSRQSALRSIFISSNYKWVKNDEGKFVIAYNYRHDKNFDGPIDLTDLDRSDKEWCDDSDYHRFIRAQNAIERHRRLAVAENIELFASIKDRDSHYGYDVIDDYSFESEYSVIANAPFGDEIDRDWLLAMEEFLSCVNYAYNRFFGIHFDKPLAGDKVPEPLMFSRMPEKFQKRLARVREWEDKCEAQSGSKARAAAFWEEIKDDVMSDIA